LIEARNGRIYHDFLVTQDCQEAAKAIQTESKKKSETRFTMSPKGSSSNNGDPRINCPKEGKEKM
jgi:hypothetical protein